jgi:hypothetical protein
MDVIRYMVTSLQRMHDLTIQRFTLQRSEAIRDYMDYDAMNEWFSNRNLKVNLVCGLARGRPKGASLTLRSPSTSAL